MTGFDFKNFGQSFGDDRGKVESYEELVNISHQFVIKVKQEHPNTKVFMCGMSMGGGVGFNLIAHHPNLVDGLVMISPGLRDNSKQLPLLKQIGMGLSYLTPWLKLIKSNGRNGSRYLLDDYNKNDPFMYHGRLWVKTFQQLMLMME